MGVHSTNLGTGSKNLKNNLVLGASGNNSLANVPSRQGNNSEIHPIINEYLNSSVPAPP